MMKHKTKCLCRKHWWQKAKVKHIFEADVSSGGTNYFFPYLLDVEICIYCNKVRSYANLHSNKTIHK